MADGDVPLAGNTPTSNIYNPANNQMNGQTYDSAGNMLSPNGNTALYDAENRLISVTEPPAFGGGVETFTYDADGHRVQKTDGGETTVYVYDVFGRLAAEYSDDVPSPPPCQTCYLSYDHLGSIRLVTDQSGKVIARHDYLPFGEEIPAGSAGRSNQYGATDYVSQRFTGQIRDSETGLDFFNARYFGAALGRFTSPDPASAGAKAGNPQTWNAYSYVLGNPLNGIDVTGKDRIEMDGLNLVAASNPLGVDPYTGGCMGGFLGGGGGQLMSAEDAYQNRVDAGFYASSVAGYLISGDPAGAAQLAHLLGYEINDVSSTIFGQTTEEITLTRTCDLQYATGYYTLGQNAVALFQPQMANALSAAFQTLNALGCRSHHYEWISHRRRSGANAPRGVRS